MSTTKVTDPSNNGKLPQTQTSIVKGNSFAAATPANFPCGSTLAKKHIHHFFRNSSDARSTITSFQHANSLHRMFAKAFGTKPLHEINSDRVKINTDGPLDGFESLDPSPALEFLSHLGVSRHEVHSRIAAAFRSAIEDEIQRMPLPSLDRSCPNGEAGHEALLNLLKSAWQFRDVPELRPILVCLLKRLGTHTPVQMLHRLGTKKDGELKNAELLSQLGPNMCRLVWEADWDAKLQAALSGTNTNAGKDDLTLRGSTLLADLIKPFVQSYLRDPVLVQGADLAFVANVSERRFATKLRRMEIADSCQSEETFGMLASIRMTKASGGMSSKVTDAEKAKEGKTNLSSARAVTGIKETIGNRPKLLGAVLDMLISEYAITGGGLTNIMTMMDSKEENDLIIDDSKIGSLLGGSTNLTCSLVADILLTFGQLPRSYEILSIMARILDASIQMGSLSDDAIVQVQGCLRIIFRPEQADLIQSPAKDNQEQDEATGSVGEHYKNALKTANEHSTIPELPVDDSVYEAKILQRILKAAIASMRENDPQSLFLNPVTDAIAPGYSSVITNPMCIRTMEEKMMGSTYETIEDYKDDTMLMFTNCVKYNVGPAGLWFRGEAMRQMKLWKEKIFPVAKSKLKLELTKRKKTFIQAQAGEPTKLQGSKKRQPPPPLAFAPPDKSAKGVAVPAEMSSKDIKDDAAINSLTAKDVDPLPPWRFKRRKKEVQIPSMQCLAAMMLADPFVTRLLLDKILRILRLDVIRGKFIPAGHTMIPSLVQLLSIGQMSMQLCALKGRRYSIPDAGIFNGVLADKEESLAYISIRRFLPIFTKMLLAVEIDRRVILGGDLHDASIQGFLSHPEVQIQEWEVASFDNNMKLLVEGAFVHLIFPGNTNEMAVQKQFPRFVVALNSMSNGNMLYEKPFFTSLSHALLRYKSKLPTGYRDLVTKCMIQWLKSGVNLTPEMRICSPLHEALLFLLNEWSLLGNLVLPKDLCLSIGEEAISAAAGVHLGEKSELFAKMWLLYEGENRFSPVKNQYLRMLSSASDTRALQWKVKMGIND